MIAFLHPIFTIVAIILIIYTFLEVYNDKKYPSLVVVVFVMVLLLGFRGVGADYGVYANMYWYMGENVPYETVWTKASFGKADLEIEWIYVLLGKIMYDANLPFFIFTFVLAFFAIFIKFFSFRANVAYPSLALLLYMFPTYFTADGGHMRQGMAMTLSILSIYFIKKRQLLGFLLTMYFAFGFHNSAATFIPAYWIVRYPLNSRRMMLIVLVCMALSPFKVYEYISILDSFQEADIYKGFDAYVEMENVSEGKINFTDLICVMNLYYLVTYDKQACAKIPYYEYLRNLAFTGICMYFIFRSNAAFSTRLIAHYFTIMIMVYPNIIAAMGSIRVKRLLHFAVVAFAVFYYFVYAKMQAPGVGYTMERYYNFLWDF